jgi:hypothetical protein
MTGTGTGTGAGAGAVAPAPARPGSASLLSRVRGQCRFVKAFTSIAYTVMPDRCLVPKG